MSAFADGAGVPLSYVERGAGAPVLLIHGTAADAAAMADAQDALAAAGARAIAYDRRGYGASGAPEAYEATTVHEQAEDAAALLRELATGPAVVAGVGFGALVALDLLLRHAGLARAGVLADPPLYAFVPEANEALSAQRAALEEAVRDHGPPRAVEVWLASEGVADAERVARARERHRAFFADLGGLASLPVSRQLLRGLRSDVVVLTSHAAPARIVSAADALAGLLPNARREQGDDVAAAAAAFVT